MSVGGEIEVYKELVNDNVISKRYPTYPGLNAVLKIYIWYTEPE